MGKGLVEVCKKSGAHPLGFHIVRIGQASSEREVEPHVVAKDPAVRDFGVGAEESVLLDIIILPCFLSGCTSLYHLDHHQ